MIIRTLVDLLKERGLRPFVTDTTTMPYHPWISRTLAMDHLETANKNGFNQGTVGCPIVMADGWLGTNDVIIDLQGRGSYLNKQFVARAIADADALLSVAHFRKGNRDNAHNFLLFPAIELKRGIFRRGDSEIFSRHPVCPAKRLSGKLSEHLQGVSFFPTAERAATGSKKRSLN